MFRAKKFLPKVLLLAPMFIAVAALCLAVVRTLPWAGTLQAAASPAEEIHFTILHTNDEHAALIPHSPTTDFRPEASDPAVGGFARLATAVQEIRAEKAAAGEPVLLLNSGDFIGGSPYSWLAPKGFAPELTIMQEIGYDAVIIGNHEFDYGTETLARYLQTAGYPEAHDRTVVLAGNAVAPKDHILAMRQLFRRSQLIELENGLKVGLFGLMGKAAQGVAYDYEPLEFSDPVETARDLTAELIAKGADVIVALTHAGVEEDRALARAVSGLHVIVGGHCHTALYEPVEENGVLIVQAGSLLKYLGRLELAFNPESGQVRARNVENNQAFLQPIDDRYALDPEIAAIIDQFSAELNSLVMRLTGGRFQNILDTVALSDFEIPDKPPLQESPFGNFVADAMRKVTSELTGQRVDIAIQANGSIRGGITPGTLEYSRGEVSFYDLVMQIGLGIGPDGYAGYPIVSVFLTGEEVRRILEVAVLLAQLMGDSYFLQFSGLRYDYDPENAVLFTVPFMDQAVPTALLPGSLGAVTRAQIYTGDGPQGRGDDGYLPLKLGDLKLYHVVTDSYILSFLPMVGEMLPMLNLELKDASGNPVPKERLDDLIVRINGQELKVWQTVVEYAAGQPLNAAGLPQIDPYYSTTAGRINPVNAFPVIVWPLLIVLTLLAVIVLLLGLAIRRFRRRRRKALFR
ncbi:MAG: bifunctional metallophosphatase/5'-nucleotidase [Dethiobacter sp.]|jgi:2',3'-cyclic-nucleotide 2'-phosphodiesterase (5'-nucleotidase family)|nr:bifunctional metallophosphatase/5'-nucleotidase [Dethiobacter sp.]